MSAEEDRRFGQPHYGHGDPRPEGFAPDLIAKFDELAAVANRIADERNAYLDASRAMLAALKNASAMLAENHGGSTATARVLIRAAIAEAEGAGTKVPS